MSKEWFLFPFMQIIIKKKAEEIKHESQSSSKSNTDSHYFSIKVFQYLDTPSPCTLHIWMGGSKHCWRGQCWQGTELLLLSTDTSSTPAGRNWECKNLENNVESILLVLTVSSWIWKLLMGDGALCFLQSQIFAYNLNIIMFQHEFGPKHHLASSFINHNHFLLF